MMRKGTVGGHGPGWCWTDEEGWPHGPYCGTGNQNEGNPAWECYPAGTLAEHGAHFQ